MPKSLLAYLSYLPNRDRFLVMLMTSASPALRELLGLNTRPEERSDVEVIELSPGVELLIPLK